MEHEIRKYYLVIEELIRDGERPLEKPLKRVAAAVVFKNPFAGKYVQDLDLLCQWSEEQAPLLTKKALQAAGIDKAEVESYGKAAIVGCKGELEHAAAVLHPKLGKPFREEVNGGKSIIPSAKKMGFPGCAIDVPLHHKDAAYVRSHFDAMEVRLPDAPNDDEILLIIAITNGGRPHPRVGGLKKEEITGEDGLK